MIAGGAEAVSDSPPTAEAVRRFGSIRLMWDGSNEMGRSLFGPTIMKRVRKRGIDCMKTSIAIRMITLQST